MLYLVRARIASRIFVIIVRRAMQLIKPSRERGLIDERAPLADQTVCPVAALSARLDGERIHLAEYLSTVLLTELQIPRPK